MRMHWIGKVFIGVLLGAAVLLGVSYVVMWLWNWLVPPVIGWKTIDFLQAMGLLVLTRLLVGFRGFGGWHHRHHHGHWRGRMQEKWASMTPEEREKFREGMRGRCGWHHRHHHGDGESTSTPGPV
jgi:hypothetical protein